MITTSFGSKEIRELYILKECAHDATGKKRNLEVVVQAIHNGSRRGLLFRYITIC